MRAKSVDCRGKENNGDPETFNGKRHAASTSAAQTNNTDKGTVSESKSLLGKRKLSGLNPSPIPAKFAKLKPDAENDGSKSMNSVVATNCKLTNTLVDLTSKLSEKQLDYERLMIRYFSEKKEKWFLQQKVERRDRTIENLNRELKHLHDTRFCNDLIEMNDVESEQEKGKYLCVMMTFLNTNKSHLESLDEAPKQRETSTSMDDQLLGVDLLLFDDANSIATVEKTITTDSPNNSEPSSSAEGRATFDSVHISSLNKPPTHSTAYDLTSGSELNSNLSIRRSITKVLRYPFSSQRTN